ncbi:MAG: cellulase family glycosylhydrolase [Actinobacteria bacterium]|nr:cellulase family glycosylhydrolase [Actinomycetota bacterium]
MRFSARVAAALLVAVGVLANAAPVWSQDSVRYRVDSPFIRDRHGRAVFFHGVNAVWKRPPYFPPSTLFGAPKSKSYFDARDARFLARHGLNLVRLGNLFVGTEPKRDRFDDTYLDKTESITKMLARRDIAVQIDFHQDMWHERYEGEGFPDWATTVPATNCCGFPGNYLTPGVTGAFERLWQNDDNLWQEYADAWAYVAERFRDEPNLIGYDFLNEPWPGAQYESCMNPAGCPQFDTEYLQPFMEKMIAAVRTKDRDNIVWWDPHVITNSGAKNNVGVVDPIADPADNQGISFHIYCIAGSESTPVRPSDDPSCPETEKVAVANQLEAAERNRSTLMLTEFGATDDDEELRRATRLADKAMTSWAYWHYGTWKDPTTTGTGGAQSLWKDDLERPRSLKQKKADILIRTYPHAVAGTPKSFRFHPRRRSRLFRLVYDADASIRPPTVVFVPVARHYGGRYRVEVTGDAKVTSRANARFLKLRNTGGGNVTVTVRRVRRPARS